jgi:hypothetical protein
MWGLSDSSGVLGSGGPGPYVVADVTDRHCLFVRSRRLWPDDEPFESNPHAWQHLPEKWSAT